MNAAPGFSHMTVGVAGVDDLETTDYHGPYMAGPMPYGAQPVYQLPQSPDDGLEFDPVDRTQTAARSSKDGPTAFKCGACGKQFVRHCDLNKHSKTHSRPYKCPVEACKYQQYGWPTEKELERHYNDKHALEPRMFACRDPSCKYKSKRESNCKQHMEKKHGWIYERSRSMKSYRCAYPGCSGCSNFEESRQNHEQNLPATPAPTTFQGHPGNSIFFGDAAPLPGFNSDVPYTHDCPESQALSDSYVPWASPPTRDQNIQELIRKVDSKFHSPFALDPQLSQPQYPNVIEEFPHCGPDETGNASFQGPSLAPSLKRSCSPPSYPHPVSHEQWTVARNHPTSKYGESSKASTGQGHKASVAASGPPPTLQSLVPSRRRVAKDEDEDCEDESDLEPPSKRPRIKVDDDFEDDQMPCPFRLSDPDFFDRNHKEKFSPCHTKHKDISTIARHLARPAHRLDVKEGFISSFAVHDEERPYPRAGLCRRCWRVFRNQAEFDGHLTQSCPRVSRGKREKFMLVFETFCLDAGSRRDGSDRQDSSSGLDDEASRPTRLTRAMDDPAHTIIVPEATPNQSGGQSSHQAGSDQERTVRLSEHLALIERVKVLEEDYKKLSSLARNALYLASGQPLTQSPRAFVVGVQSGNGAAYPVASPLSSLAREYSRREPESEEIRDRESLVGGMDSRSTDVDRDVFVPEAQRTNSGFSSSTDKSSLRHVSPGLRQDDPSAEDEGGQISGAQTKTPQRPAPPPSDSGYSSMKHTSVQAKDNVLAGLGPSREQGEARNETDRVSQLDTIQEEPQGSQEPREPGYFEAAFFGSQGQIL